MLLLVLFIAVPIIEIALFIQIGGLIGLWPTLLIVIITAILGTTLVRQQGAATLLQLRGSFSNLSDPTEPLANGAMILFSGALLLTPGFFTDAIGFALLIPTVRAVILAELRKRVKVQSFKMGGSVHASGFAGSPHSSSSADNASRDGQTIDGKFEEIEIKEDDTQGHSGWTRH